MKIADTRRMFLDGHIAKPEFIRTMFELHHAKLFDYAEYLQQTNIAAIEIRDGRIVMTSRDKAVKMICPPGDYRAAPIETLNFLEYESEDSTMIMQLVSPDSCVLDIGANMGWYAINIAKTYPACMIHAFEPVPKTYRLLVENVTLNKINNVVTHNFGFSDEGKDLTFFFYPEGSGNASSENLSEREDIEKIVCHVEALDDFANRLNLPRVDFIKCDVEGAELFVFRGGKKLLERDKPIVFSEMLRKWSAKFGYHPNEIIALFSSLGYRCFYADQSTLKELHEMTDETVETNFFFLHQEKHARKIGDLA